MGLFPVKGSVGNNEDVTNTSQTVVATDDTFDSQLLKQKYTKNTFHNLTALNFSRMDPVIDKLKTYTEGAPITVTYYSQITNYSNKGSHTSDYSYNLDNIHKAYSKINNLQIRLNGGFEYQYDEEAHEANVEGTGKVVSGVKVIVGDIFLYELYPGQLGLFLINNVNPLALHREASNEISFTLKEFVNNDVIEKLEKCTVDTYYYTTQKIMGDTTALLKREDYFNLVTTMHMREKLIEIYSDLFYSKDKCSLMRPDNIYDPYVVDFFNKLLSFKDSTYYPFIQMAFKNEYGTNCIFTELLEDNTDLSFTISKKFVKEFKSFNLMSAHINGLHNNYFIRLDDTNGEEFYIFSEAFYLKDMNNVNMTEFEKFLLTYIDNKTIDIPRLHLFAQEIKTIDPLLSFYRVPVMIFLCNKIISTI